MTARRGERARRCTLGALLLVSGLAAGTPPARADDLQRGTELADLDLEQLMTIRITSVSKKQEPLLDAPAAVYVITQEDIRRSGFTSIPELLRMVPGLQVAHINGNRWAISARGFNGPFANKLLVLIDGRTVYTPLFSGVYWDVQDTMLEDIDRIEVIRGPGATLWGANAVNGVINIITKDAADTQGALVTAGGGTEERGFGAVRYGGSYGSGLAYRLYAKYFDRDPQVDDAGHDAADGWDVGRGGFRLDWRPPARGVLTVQGDLYKGGAGQTFDDVSLTRPFVHRDVEARAHLAGGNLVARWSYVLSERSDLALQLYYDATDRDIPQLRETVHTGDLDFEHRLKLGATHDVVWGLGYRVTGDDVRNRFALSLLPDHRRYQLFSGFVQDDVVLVPDRLRLTIGTKLEHNDFSGLEVQPSARLLWAPHEGRAIWLAVSRAVRTPSRAERDFQRDAAVIPMDAGPPGLVVFRGNRAFRSEKLIAYEVGYRTQPWESLSLDVAGFFNVYDDLRTSHALPPELSNDPEPHLVLPQQLANGAHGETYGVETAATWRPLDRWRLAVSSTWLKMQLRHDGSNRDAGVHEPEGESPQHQFNVRSSLDLPRRLELDLGLYYVDRLSSQHTPSYLRLDTRIGWRPTGALELSVALQNLLDDRHPEFGDAEGVDFSEIERSVYGKITLRF